MTDYQTYVTQLQKQFLTAMQTVGEIQAKLIEAVRDVPHARDRARPNPAEFVEKSFDFVTQVLDAQKDMTLRLIKATGVTAGEDRRQAGRLIPAVGMSRPFTRISSDAGARVAPAFSCLTGRAALAYPDGAGSGGTQRCRSSREDSRGGRATARSAIASRRVSTWSADFPVLSTGPTPHTPLSEWTFSITGEVDDHQNAGRGRTSATSRASRSRATFTASPNGRSSTRPGRASRSTRSSSRSTPPPTT